MRAVLKIGVGQKTRRHTAFLRSRCSWTLIQQAHLVVQQVACDRIIRLELQTPDDWCSGVQQPSDLLAVQLGPEDDRDRRICTMTVELL